MRHTKLRYYIVAIALLGALQIDAAGSIARAATTGALANGYHVEENWAKLPDGRIWSGVAGVNIDPDGKSIWVLDRCVEIGMCATSEPAPIQKFDAMGRRVAAFGAGLFVVPHGFFVDREGNVWTTDFVGKGGKGHTVMKFSPDGRLLMTLGKPGLAGDGPDQFNAPSGVVVAANGDIFVADGHGGKTNARIVKFSKTGTFIKSWGKPGSAPGEFSTPHAIAIDSVGRIFVADRGNQRIQIFDQDGKFIAAWSQFGDPSGVFIDGHDIIYVANIDLTSVNPDERGIRVGNAKDGVVTNFIPTSDRFEAIAADHAGRIYVGSALEKTLKRFVKD